MQGALQNLPRDEGWQGLLAKEEQNSGITSQTNGLVSRGSVLIHEEEVIFFSPPY